MLSLINKRIITFLIAVCTLLFSISFNAMANEKNEDYSKYIIPLEFYDGDNFEPTTLRGSTKTNALFQIQDNALLEQQSDGKYKITLYYHSYSAMEMIQVLDNSTVGNLKERYESPNDIPMGDYNKPNQWLTTTQSKIDKIEALISNEANGYYLQNAEICLADADMDIGSISFTISNLSDPIYIYSIYSLQYNDANYGRCTVIDLLEEQIQGYPDSLSYPEGNYTLGYGWYNYGDCVFTYGNRKNRPEDIALGQRLNRLLKKDVSVSADNSGRLTATFTFDDLSDIQYIQIAKERKVADIMKNGTLAQKNFMQNEFIWTTYETVWSKNDGTNTLSLTFDNMYDGYYFRIFPEDYARYYKEETVQYVTRAWYGFLKLEPVVGETVTDITHQDKNGGSARIIAASDALDADVDFYFDEVPVQSTPTYVDIQSTNGYRRFAKGEEFCHIYDSFLKLNGTSISKLDGEVILEYEIPDNWNLDTTTIALFTADGNSKLNGLIDYIDKETRVFRYSTSNLNEIHGTWVFIDTGKLSTQEELNSLEDGIYKVRLTLAHNSYSFRPSMANRSILNNTGYLEVNTNIDGKKELLLYYEMEPVIISSVTGYMTGESYCIGDDKTTAKPVTVLEYYHDNEGNLAIDDWAEEYGFHYLKRLMFPLVESKADKTSWLVRFSVPAMDSTIGDGSGVQYAALRISDPTETESNPLAGYEKSVLLAEIENAQEYLAGISSDGEEYAKISTAVQSAKEAYETIESDDEIISALNALKDVLPESGITELLQDGTYDIPFNIWKRNEETSHEYENYFAPTIQLTRKGSNITILINSLKVDNDYITSVSAL